jgi:hypothetical protein
MLDAAESSFLLLALELVRTALGTIELAALVVLAAYLGTRALRDEVDAGSWHLLRLAPVPVERVLLGKALGVAAIVLAVHGYASTLLLAYTPFVRRTHLEVWGELLAYYMVALSVIPEAFVYASIERGDRRSAIFFRALTLVRIGVALFLLRLTIDPDASARGAGLLALGRAFLTNFTDVYPMSGASPMSDVLYAGPAVPWTILLVWLGLSGVGIWQFLVVRRWRR